MRFSLGSIFFNAKEVYMYSKSMYSLQDSTKTKFNRLIMLQD